MRRIKVAEAQFGKTTKKQQQQKQQQEQEQKKKKKKKKQKKKKKNGSGPKNTWWLNCWIPSRPLGDNNHISLVQHSLKELHVWS